MTIREKNINKIRFCAHAHCFLGFQRSFRQLRTDEKIRVSRGFFARGGLCEHVCEFAFAGFDWN
jgi:hypothetical protein